MTRAERRQEERRVQKKRIKVAESHGFKVVDERQAGHYKDCHFGCGCSLCKPFKHGFDNPVKHSELVRLQKEDDLDYLP